MLLMLGTSYGYIMVLLMILSSEIYTCVSYHAVIRKYLAIASYMTHEAMKLKNRKYCLWGKYTAKIQCTYHTNGVLYDTVGVLITL